MFRARHDKFDLFSHSQPRLTRDTKQPLTRPFTMSLADGRRRGDRKISDDPNNKNWASDKGRIGFKLLQKMGWSEGKGLGLRGDGITQAIKVAPCVENLGIGAAEAIKNDKKDWTATSASFEELLSRVNSVCAAGEENGESGEKSKKKPKSDKKEKNDKIKKDKKKHKDSKTKIDQCTQPDKIEKDDPTSADQTGSSWKHRSKYIKNKSVTSYSSQDLSAIFGTAAITAP